MIQNLAGQFVGAQMIDATAGGNFVGTVTVYVTGDHGPQVQGTTNSGVCAPQGHGYYNYQPSAAETNFGVVAFTFTGSNAIDTTIQTAPLPAAPEHAVTP